MHLDRGELAHEFVDAQLEHSAADQLAAGILAMAQRDEQRSEIGPWIGLAALLERLEAVEMDRPRGTVEHHVVEHGPAFRACRIGDQQPEGAFAHRKRIG